jgi:hypothetical protein
MNDKLNNKDGHNMLTTLFLIFFLIPAALCCIPFLLIIATLPFAWVQAAMANDAKGKKII